MILGEKWRDPRNIKNLITFFPFSYLWSRCTLVETETQVVGKKKKKIKLKLVITRKPTTKLII